MRSLDALGRRLARRPILAASASRGRIHREPRRKRYTAGTPSAIPARGEMPKSHGRKAGRRSDRSKDGGETEKNLAARSLVEVEERGAIRPLSLRTNSIRRESRVLRIEGYLPKTDVLVRVEAELLELRHLCPDQYVAVTASRRPAIAISSSRRVP
jgi:hypothetical protein